MNSIKEVSHSVTYGARSENRLFEKSSPSSAAAHPANRSNSMRAACKVGAIVNDKEATIYWAEVV